MNADSIQIHRSEPQGQYEVVGKVKVRKGAQPTPFNKRPTEADVDVKLRAKAAKMGADAVIGVTYKPGIIPSSWRGMTAKGTAVKMD